MKVDGRRIANEIKNTLAEKYKEKLLGKEIVIVFVGDNPVIRKFVDLKKKFASQLGLSVREFGYPAQVKFDAIARDIEIAGKDEKVCGIVVQLPLPEGMHTQKILNLVPVKKDIDVLSEQALNAFKHNEFPFIPPVAGAIQEIFNRHDVNLAGRKILVLGYGRLVGIPVAMWLRQEDAFVSVVDKPVQDLEKYTYHADIIISGVGNPRLIKPVMLKDNVVLVDAGVSEERGKLVGDIEKECEEKASLFVPSPGGIGPITIAVLFRNLSIMCCEIQK